MPSVLHVFLCSAAALLFWGTVGLALGRRLLPASLALPVAPALGWAVHSALALPLYRLIGFTPLTVALGSLFFLAAAGLLLRSPMQSREADIRIPPWGLCARGPARRRAGAGAVSEILRRCGNALPDRSSIIPKSPSSIEMTRLGLPPGNPFFGEAGHDAPLAYYYLWHFSAAELALISRRQRLGSRHRAVGVHGVFFGGADDGLCRLDRRPRRGWAVGCTSCLCRFAASGARSSSLARRISTRTFLPPTGFAGWLFQTTWAPQHIGVDVMRAAVELAAVATCARRLRR